MCSDFRRIVKIIRSAKVGQLLFAIARITLSYILANHIKESLHLVASQLKINTTLYLIIESANVL